MNGLKISFNHPLGDLNLDIHFTAPEKGVTALIGHSGSGKTSVLRAIAGLLRVQQGKISFNNHIWQDNNSFLVPYKRPIAYVFQEPSLFPHLSVKENLEIGWKQLPAVQQAIDKDEAIKLLRIEPLLQRSSDTLSGGEKQRIAIARALLTCPEILLMDEPLSALDQGAKQQIFPYLEKLHEQLGIPVIYVTHDTNEAAMLADQMVLLEHGKVIANGQTADLLTRLDLPLACFDKAVSILEGIISSHDASYHLTWISMNCGRVAVSRENQSVGKKARVQIQAKDVSLSLKYHSDTSIINILPATVIECKNVNDCQLIVRLQLDDGQTLLSRITKRSAVTLNIITGMSLYAQVKSVALIS